tara:strand:+ start:32426 stop:34084 length:1659 start_codon:yes stop_codon:yes gene_type:complete
MGLFDNANFDDPKTMGLLAAAAQMFNASAPSTKPTSLGQVFGGGLMGGLNAYQSSRQQQQKDDMEKAQLDMLRVKMKKENDMSDAKNKWIASLMGGGSEQSPSNAETALAQGAAGGSIGPTVENASRMSAMPTQQARSNNGIPSLPMILQGAVLGMPGMKEAFDINKYVNDGVKRDAGSFYKNPLTGEMEYIADPTKGVKYDPNTQTVSEMKGFSGTNAAIKKAETLANEEAKASLDAMPTGFVDYATGRPFAGSRLDYIRRTQMQNLQPQSAQEFPDTLPTGAQTGLDLSKLTPQQIQALQRQDPKAFASGVRSFGETSSVQSPSQSGIQLQSESEKAAALANVDIAKKRAQGEIDIKQSLSKDRLSSLEKNAQANQNILGMLNSAEKIINEGTLGNSPLDRVKQFGQNAGLYQTNEAINTNILGQIGNQLVLARGSLGAGVSVSDADRYDKAAGDFTRAQSNEQRIKAIKLMREVAQNSFKDTNSIRDEFNRTGETPEFKPPSQQPTQPPQQPVMQARPTPNAINKGRLLVEHATGKKYRSNGMQWIEEK